MVRTCVSDNRLNKRVVETNAWEEQKMKTMIYMNQQDALINNKIIYLLQLYSLNYYKNVGFCESSLNLGKSHPIQSHKKNMQFFQANLKRDTRKFAILFLHRIEQERAKPFIECNFFAKLQQRKEQD